MQSFSRIGSLNEVLDSKSMVMLHMWFVIGPNQNMQWNRKQLAKLLDFLPVDQEEEERDLMPAVRMYLQVHASNKSTVLSTGIHKRTAQLVQAMAEHADQDRMAVLRQKCVDEGLLTWESIEQVKGLEKDRVEMRRRAEEDRERTYQRYARFINHATPFASCA